MELNYTYTCDKCGKQKTNSEMDSFICECKGTLKYDSGVLSYEPLTPYWSENLDRKPIYIESRSQRARLMKEKKVEIMPYKRNEYEGYRPVVNGHKMTNHEYEKAQKRGFNPGR